jgi:hypothetical protein
VWYVNADEAELANALIDKDGNRHHASLPQGLVSSDAVNELRSRATREVHPKLAELVAATRDPAEQQRADPVPGALWVRPADHDEFLAVQAFDLEPGAPIGFIPAIDPLRYDPFQTMLACEFVNCGPWPIW